LYLNRWGKNVKIPSLILKQLYTLGSLENVEGGVRFILKNRLGDASLTKIQKISFDGKEIDLDQVRLVTDDGDHITPLQVTSQQPVSFPLKRQLHITWLGGPLDIGTHKIAIQFMTEPHGQLSFEVKDTIRKEKESRASVPCDKDGNFKPEIIAARQEFLRSFSDTEVEHVSSYSFDPATTEGNIENFIGVAQIPIGLAGPIKVNGEHASGDFLIPLATTEGTLVASYNRGMKVLSISGGVTTTVQDDRMQRAPVFVFDSAREARAFRDWVLEHMDGIRSAAEATSRIARLLDIDMFLSNKFAYLRFNYATGDAAGQNMVGRATFAACSWILDRIDTVRSFYLESNLATDKKHSQINIMRTRGKRVTAEAVIPRDVLVQHMRVEPESLHYHSSVSNVGAFLSGANNNGAHSPNGITAMFIATGQDVANVAESSSGIIYTEVTAKRELYISITIPSLIVATYGGGTGLATQKECLSILGCTGSNKVKKLAEIVAAVALAGEISLGAAISSLDWVSSHEKYGRNR
jgi:hydroxymethylglutaryl-CoA reductase (NADPH)